MKPFGGYKESGSRLGEASGAAWVGREGELQGLAAYCREDRKKPKSQRETSEAKPKFPFQTPCVLL